MIALNTLVRTLKSDSTFKKYQPLNSIPNKMDYRQKMVVPATHHKIKSDEDDDDDLEALRLAALKSLRTREHTQSKKSMKNQIQNIVPEVPKVSCISFKNQRLPRRAPGFHNRSHRQNGNMYYQSYYNPNLIAIVPVDEHAQLVPAEPIDTVKVEKFETQSNANNSVMTTESKFHRFNDTASSEEEAESREITNNIKTEEAPELKEDDSPETEKDIIKEDVTEIRDKTPEKQEENEEENDEDDDVLLMADLEEEDSLERLMDEMEREMNVDKPSGKREKKSRKRESREIKNERLRLEENRKNNKSPPPVVCEQKNDRLSMSPHTNRIPQKHRSLSPKVKARKKSPRRSPRRSPVRQLKKSREIPREVPRYRSPRRSPSRYSPRLRLSKLSPRDRSPRFSPRRSPLRRVSPRASPYRQRSRSPLLLSRSKSPRPLRSPKLSPRSKSPRMQRSRSPKFTPTRVNSRSPVRPGSPVRRISSRSLSSGYSPTLSPPRRRSRSPRTPKKSPWSSPRNSPKLSPKRRRSPKESRKHGQKSSPPYVHVSPYNRKISPVKVKVSPDRLKAKQKEEQRTSIETREQDINSDPILEARKRKFECTTPIDPNQNKKIKLNKHEPSKIKVKEAMQMNVTQLDKIEEYDCHGETLYLDTTYDIEDLESVSEKTPVSITSSVNSCLEVEVTKKENKEKSSKKKKKRDKEIYQVGKSKGELPLSERIGKDKKYKKRKEVTPDTSKEEVEAIFEDLSVDEESDLRTELSRRRAERLNRLTPLQSVRLVQSAFKGVVNEVVKNNAKINQRHVIKNDDKPNQKEVRRVTVLHRAVSDFHDSEDDNTYDSKVPVRFRLGLNKPVQEPRESKTSRKTSKRQSRKD